MTSALPFSICSLANELRQSDNKLDLEAAYTQAAVLFEKQAAAFLKQQQLIQAPAEKSSGTRNEVH